MSRTPGTPLSPAEQARQALGAAIRRGDPPGEVDEARRVLDEAKLDAKIAEIVARAPELTPSQYADLARALGVVPETAETAGNDAA